jgi:hypothetical protein
MKRLAFLSFAVLIDLLLCRSANPNREDAQYRRKHQPKDDVTMSSPPAPAARK